MEEDATFWSPLTVLPNNKGHVHQYIVNIDGTAEMCLFYEYAKKGKDSIIIYIQKVNLSVMLIKAKLSFDLIHYIF